MLLVAGDGEDALARQLAKLVVDLAGLTVITQAAGQTTQQPEPSVRDLQQGGWAIGAAVVLVEAGENGLVTKVRRQRTLCYSRIVHAKASEVAESGVATAFSTRRLSCVQDSWIIRVGGTRGGGPPMNRHLDREYRATRHSVV